MSNSKIVTPDTDEIFDFIFSGANGFLENGEIIASGVVESSTLDVTLTKINLSFLRIRITPTTAIVIKVGGAISANIAGFTPGEHYATAKIVTSSGREVAASMHFNCVDL